MRRFAAAVVLIAAAAALSGCATGASAPSTSAAAKADVRSDLYKANTAVLKFLGANSGTTISPTTASLGKYGFTPSKYTKKFEYFSTSGGVRYCIQASTSSGAVSKLYIENNSKFSSISSGGCVAGVNY